MKPLLTFLSSKWIGVLKFASVKLRDSSDVCDLVTSFIIHLKSGRTVMNLHLAEKSHLEQSCIGDTSLNPSPVREMPALQIAGKYCVILCEM